MGEDEILEEKEVPKSLLSALESLPMAYLIPKQELISVLTPQNLDIYSQSVVFKNGDGNDDLDEELINQLAGQEPDLQFIKFNGSNSSDQILSDTTQFSDLERFIINSVAPIDSKSYRSVNLKIDPLNFNDNNNDLDDLIEQFLDNSPKPNKRKQVQEFNDNKKIKLEAECSSQDIKASFQYYPSIKESIIDDINYTALERLLSQLSDATSKESSEFWIDFPLLFGPNESHLFVKPKCLMQLRGYIQSLIKSNSIGILKSEIINQIRELTVDALINIETLEWNLFIESNNILEWKSLIAIWEISILSTLILIDIMLSCTDNMFIENQMGYAWKSIILLGTNFKSLFTLNTPTEIIPDLRPIIELYTTLQSKAISFLIDTTVDENYLGELEYVFMDIIFVEISKSKESTDALTNVLEYLRKHSCDVLVAIYRYYPSQREIILGDLVDRFDQLSILKSKGKQYRLGFGVSVQIFSVLIVSIIQSYGKMDFEFNSSYWKLLDLPNKTKSEKDVIEDMQLKFQESLKSYQSEIQKVSDKFIQLLFKRILNEYNSELKKILELFFNDLLLILDYPQYPAAETLLVSALMMSMWLAMTESTPANIQAYCLELIGKIISKLLMIKNNNNVSAIPVVFRENNFEEISLMYGNVLAFLSQSDEIAHDFLLFKYIALLQTRLKEIESDIKEEDVLASSNNRKLLNLVRSQLHDLIEGKFGSLKSKSFPELTASEVINNYQSVLITQPLSKGYQNLINFTSQMLNDPKVKVRSAAVKSLSLLVDKDPLLLNNNSLKSVIETRLSEGYYNVSDSILELLSNYLKSNPAEIEGYYRSICGRVFDLNLSVKKRAMKLITELYNKTDNIIIETKIAETLLAKLTEEENSLVNLGCESLINILFVNTGKMFIDEEKTTNNKLRLRNEMNNTIDVLTSLFKTNENTWIQFERFIKEKVTYISDLNKKNVRFIKFTLGLLINRILERVVETDRTTNDKEGLMALLSVLVKSDNKLISQDQLLSLQPYIIDDNTSGGSKLCYYTLQVLNVSLSQNTKNLDERFVETCRKSLLTRLTKFSASELNEAMQCIWKLSKGNDENIMLLSRACIKVVRMLLIYSQKKQNNVMFQGDFKLRRLLFLVGSFSKHCNFEKCRSLFVSEKIGLKKESVMLYLLNNILYYCDSSLNFEVRVDAIKNALGICITHPKTFRHPKVMALMDSGFKKKDEGIKVVIINAITSFMTRIEAQSNEKNGLGYKRSDEIAFDKRVYHGEGKDDEKDAICSNLVQKYFKQILECCLSSDDELSLISVKFLQLAINFGFAIPMVCFPTVSALECSRSGYVKQIAMNMHKRLFEGFSSLVESCYIPAFKTTIHYANILYPGMNIIRCQNYLKYFIRLVRESGSAVKIKKVFASIEKVLVKNINIHEFKKFNESELIEQQGLAVFMALNIRCAEFSSTDEILNIIVFLEKLILSQSSNVIQQYQLVFYEGDDDMDDWFKYMIMAKCLVILQRLKLCLMNNYGITSVLILKYQEDPKGKEFKNNVQVNEENNLKLDDLDLLLYNRNKEYVSFICEMLQTTVE